MTKIAVLGLGRMGHAISDDLTLVERRAERLLQPLRRAPGPRCASGCAFRGGHLPGGWLPETLEGIRPVLSTLSDHVKHYGRPEIASSAKLAVNLILLPGVATLAEAVTVGRAGGLGGGEPNDLLADSPMMGPGIRHPEPLPDRPGRLGTTWWTTELGAKDARPATEQVESEGLTRLRLGPLIRDPYQAAAHAGLSEDDIAFVSRLYR